MHKKNLAIFSIYSWTYLFISHKTSRSSVAGTTHRSSRNPGRTVEGVLHSLSASLPATSQPGTFLVSVSHVVEMNPSSGVPGLWCRLLQCLLISLSLQSDVSLILWPHCYLSEFLIWKSYSAYFRINVNFLFNGSFKIPHSPLPPSLPSASSLGISPTASFSPLLHAAPDPTVCLLSASSSSQSTHDWLLAKS